MTTTVFRLLSFLLAFLCTAAIVYGFQSPAPQLNGRVRCSMSASMIDGGGSSLSNGESLSSKTIVAALSSNDDSNHGHEVVDWDWKHMAEDVFTDDERPIVLFDGVCTLCDAGVNFAMDQDQSAKFRFCSLQSKVAQSLLLRSGRDPHDNSNIMLITKDDAYVSSDAVSRICMDLDPRPLQMFGHLGQYTPSWVREGLFQFVSQNRNRFGEQDSCRIDFDGTYTSRFVSDPEEYNI